MNLGVHVSCTTQEQDLQCFMPVDADRVPGLCSFGPSNWHRKPAERRFVRLDGEVCADQGVPLWERHVLGQAGPSL